MDIFFKTNKDIVKMKDKISVERGYLTTSSLDGKEIYALKNYRNDEKALEILNKIDYILDEAIKKNIPTISIDLNGDKNE